MIFLYSSGVLGTELMGQSTTNEQGDYVIAESQLPVVTASARSSQRNHSLRRLLRLRDRSWPGSGLEPHRIDLRLGRAQPRRHSAPIAPGQAGGREPDIS